MSGIGGKIREQQEGFQKRVGLAEVKVIAVNPNREEFKEILNRDLDEDSKADKYLGESKEGNTTLRVDFWLEDVKTKQRDKVSFFLEDKQKVNKDGSKKQYINNLGTCSWADDENNLPDFFIKRGEYRVAFVGEEELYTFLRTWLGNLDYKDAETTLQLDWKTLMKGNVKDLKAQVNGEYAVNIVVLLTVKTVVKEGEDAKQYQSVYNRGFLPVYAIKQFRLVDYTKKDVLSHLASKKSKDLKPHERFVLQVTGEYGCKDSFVLKDAKEFNEADFLVSSNAPMSSDGDDY